MIEKAISCTVVVFLFYINVQIKGKYVLNFNIHALTSLRILFYKHPYITNRPSSVPYLDRNVSASTFIRLKQRHYYSDNIELYRCLKILFRYRKVIMCKHHWEIIYKTDRCRLDLLQYSILIVYDLHLNKTHRLTIRATY